MVRKDEEEGVESWRLKGDARGDLESFGEMGELGPDFHGVANVTAWETRGRWLHSV